MKILKARINMGKFKFKVGDKVAAHSRREIEVKEDGGIIRIW